MNPGAVGLRAHAEIIGEVARGLGAPGGNARKVLGDLCLDGEVGYEQPITNCSSRGVARSNSEQHGRALHGGLYGEGALCDYFSASQADHRRKA